MVNDLFKKVPIEVPNKSGFDMTHEHNFTTKVGTLTPAMVDLLYPNDSINLSVGSEIQLPPMATDFYGRVRAHFEAFFVPLRVLYAGWQHLITQDTTSILPNLASRPWMLPPMQVPITEMKAGSLSDYLGYGFDPSGTVDPTAKISVLNPLKYVAYHKIWEDYYRDSRIQQYAFSPVTQSGNTSIGARAFSRYPYMDVEAQAPVEVGFLATTTCADGVQAYSLRQRNFGRDYFTNASPKPQAGDPAQVSFAVENGQGSFSIASLRAANALQTWLERNNIAGQRYGDQIRAHFGIYPSDAALQRPIYLGRQIIDVYNKSVFQSDENVSGGSSSSNPFMSVGAKYGSPLGVGSGKLVDNFTASEHGFIFVMFSLVPDAVYSGIIDRDIWYSKSSDFAFPLLSGVGDEPITVDELVGYAAKTQSEFYLMHQATFGYTQRYSSLKFKLDRVSGLLKEGQSLASFALQRSFLGSGGSDPTISTSFLEIPTDFLDGVAAVNGDVSRYGCWAQNTFNYHKVSTFPAYSIPTLGDMKNTHTEVVPNGGIRL